jgi:GNAT superfamily N-acetyltransferase
MILKRVNRLGTLEKIRTWILESRPPGSQVILDGRYYALVEDGDLLGAVGLKRLAWFATEIKHLVIAPQHRQRGHGRALLRLAIEKVATPLVFATVRADNEHWLRVNTSEGFHLIRGVPTSRGEVQLLWTVGRIESPAGGTTPPESGLPTEAAQ